MTPLTENTDLAYNLPLKGGGFMGGSVQYQKSAKRYYIQIYWQGERIRIWRHPKSEEPFFDKRAAVKQLSIIQDQIDDKIFDPKYWKPDSQILIRNYASDWLDEKKEEVTHKTWQGYRTAVDKYIIPELGSLDIRHVRARHIKDFKKKLAGILSTKGVYNNVGALIECFYEGRRAREEGRSYNTNPYLPGTKEHEQFDSGWYAANHRLGGWDEKEELLKKAF